MGPMPVGGVGQADRDLINQREVASQSVLTTPMTSRNSYNGRNGRRITAILRGSFQSDFARLVRE